MKAIVKVLLEKGIDEQTIHEVLDIIQEVEIPSFVQDAQRKRENAEAYHKMKAEQEAKEKAQQEKDKNEVKASIYQAKAMRNLQKSVAGKKSKAPVVESVLECIEEILSEGRKEGETQEQFTRRLAGEMYPKIKAKMATQKSIRRNAEKVEKGAAKEEKEHKKNAEELTGVVRSKRDEFDKAYDNSNNASDIYVATRDTHGYGHPATDKAKKDYDKASKKFTKAANSLNNAEEKVDVATKQQEEARDRKWNAQDKKQSAQHKVNDLSGKATRADHRRDPFA